MKKTSHLTLKDIEKMNGKDLYDIAEVDRAMKPNLPRPIILQYVGGLIRDLMKKRVNDFRDEQMEVIENVNKEHSESLHVTNEEIVEKNVENYIKKVRKSENFEIPTKLLKMICSNEISTKCRLDMLMKIFKNMDSKVMLLSVFIIFCFVKKKFFFCQKTENVDNDVVAEMDRNMDRNRNLRGKSISREKSRSRSRERYKQKKKVEGNEEIINSKEGDEIDKYEE